MFLQSLILFIIFNSLNCYSSENLATITHQDFATDNDAKVRKLLKENGSALVTKKISFSATSSSCEKSEQKNTLLEMVIMRGADKIAKSFIYYRKDNSREQIDLSEDETQSSLEFALVNNIINRKKPYGNSDDYKKIANIIYHLVWVGDSYPRFELLDDKLGVLTPSFYEEIVEFLPMIIKKRQKITYAVLKKKKKPEIPEDLINIIINFTGKKTDEEKKFFNKLGKLKETTKEDRELQQKKKIEACRVFLEKSIEILMIIIKNRNHELIFDSFDDSNRSLSKIIALSLTYLVIKPSFFLSNVIYEKHKPYKFASKLKKLEYESQEELLQNKLKETRIAKKLKTNDNYVKIAVTTSFGLFLIYLLSQI